MELGPLENHKNEKSSSTTCTKYVEGRQNNRNDDPTLQMIYEKEQEYESKLKNKCEIMEHNYAGPYGKLIKAIKKVANNNQAPTLSERVALNSTQR